MNTPEIPQQNQLEAAKKELKNLLAKDLSIDELINVLAGLDDGQISESDVDNPAIIDIIKKFESAGYSLSDLSNLAHGIEGGQVEL